jgi:hypothetical protein
MTDAFCIELATSGHALLAHHPKRERPDLRRSRVPIHTGFIANLSGSLAQHA